MIGAMTPPRPSALWITKLGEKILVRDMRDEHLEQVISDFDQAKNQSHPIYPKLIAELKRRKENKKQ